MSPEFVAILEEREQLRRWFLLLPVCLGLLTLIISVVKSRKDIALLHITLLTVASVAIPTIMGGLWWSELREVATSHEDTDWILNHDGGRLIAPLFATLISTMFWIIAVLILATRQIVKKFRKHPGREKAMS